MKVLVATQKPFAPAAVNGIREIIEKAGGELSVLEKYEDRSELVEAVKDADALIVRSDKVTAEVVEAAEKLKVVVRAGAGYDNLDLDACTRRGVVAMNTPGQNSNAVAELAIAFMLFMARTQFTPATGSELSGRTLGIQAFGNVGRLVGKKAVALGMKVKVFSTSHPAEQIREIGAEPAGSLAELYSTCDYVSVHIPAKPDTRGSIGFDLLSSMPRGAVLVNTARKEVMDESGLEKALEARPDLKYITDVAPDNLDALREKFGLRVFATPRKMGAQTAEANMNAGLAAARQIVDYFREGDSRFKIN